MGYRLETITSLLLNFKLCIVRKKKLVIRLIMKRVNANCCIIGCNYLRHKTSYSPIAISWPSNGMSENFFYELNCGFMTG